jgi:hypothetical protein
MSIPNRKFKSGDVVEFNVDGRMSVEATVDRPSGYYADKGHTYDIIAEGRFHSGIPESRLVLRERPRAAAKASSKLEDFTIVFIDQRGLPIDFERMGVMVNFFHDKSSRNAIFRYYERAVREDHSDEFPPGTQVVGVWAGKIRAKKNADDSETHVSVKDLEKKAPVAYVHMNGEIEIF